MSPARALTRPPLRRILVGTDFSANSRRALGRALRLPLAERAELHLAHVLPSLGRLPSELDRRLRDHAETRLARLCARVERSKVVADRRLRVRWTLRMGTASEELVRMARESEAELLVIGRHGTRRLPRLLIGSVADRVLRMSERPVLLVHAPPLRAYRRPLVAMDDPVAVRPAFEMLMRLRPQGPSPIVVLHAHEVVHALTLRNAGATEADLLRYATATRREFTRRYTEVLRAWRGQGVRLAWVQREGPAKQVILDEVVRRRCDLIVVGTHGRAGLRRVLLGSVAEAVVQLARADVLVSRAPRFSFKSV